MKKLVKEILNEEFQSKTDLFIRLRDLDVEEKMNIALCNFFDSHELVEFVEFLENEWK